MQGMYTYNIYIIYNNIPTFHHSSKLTIQHRNTMSLVRELPAFIYRQLFVTPPLPAGDCTGKTIIVTGANVGLGKEAARHFVEFGE